MKLSVSPLAEQDIEAIGDDIAQDNPVRAADFIEELYQQCLLIGETPVLYRQRPELGTHIRSCAYDRMQGERNSSISSGKHDQNREYIPDKSMHHWLL
ncbi:type II toxin-antitoxin system RelE/ParE family toxin [Pantoea sp. B65]|uniref:type II toxin-antitoxin system RelE/ParE family toxin n=1 Tax=Pantoea sp. B65 TaxID=2813359 RepID=UPI0039B4400B